MRRGFILVVLVIAHHHRGLAGSQSSAFSNSARKNGALRFQKPLLTEANSGSTQAQFNWASPYQYGKRCGKPRAYEAAQVDRMAANSGIRRPEQSRILYETGQVRSHGFDRGAKCDLRAARRGNPMAQLPGHDLYPESGRIYSVEGLTGAKSGKRGLSFRSRCRKTHARANSGHMDPRQAFTMTMLPWQRQKPGDWKPKWSILRSRIGVRSRPHEQFQMV